MSTNKIGQVIWSSPECIKIEIVDLKIFEENKEILQVGRFLKIAQGNNDFVIAIINNIKGYNKTDDSGIVSWQFEIE